MPDVISPPQTALNLIDGEWRPSKSGRTFENRNPADTRDLVALLQASGPEDVKDAVDAAERAFPAWANTPAPVRGKILLRAAQLLESRLNDVADLLSREEGKTIAEAKGETTRAVRILEYFAGEGARFSGDTIPSERPRVFMYTIRQPLGVVALIAPWNFPIAIPTWKLAPALVSGNTVVIKPASQAPLTSVRLVEILHEAGIPKGVLNLVTGSGRDVGDPLVSQSEGARHLVHRLGRGRPRHREDRRGAARARAARNGRQESDDRAGRRGPRRRGRLRVERRVLLDRSALHRHQPRHRRKADRRGVPRSPARADREAAASAIRAIRRPTSVRRSTASSSTRRWTT